jgi:hypothetical protein
MRKLKRIKMILRLMFGADILALVDELERIDLCILLVNIFETVQYEVNDEFSYLGMHISVGSKSAIIDMRNYVQNVTKDISVEEERLPGTKTSFKVDEISPRLVETERKEFQSMTDKLLYLAKRARPDILTMLCFLCTRVQEPTEDEKKAKPSLKIFERDSGYMSRFRSKG